MIRRSFARHFDTMAEAVTAIFEHIVEFGEIMLDPSVIAALLVGAILSGVLAELVSRRWS
jgi:hypothetical protein